MVLVHLDKDVFIERRKEDDPNERLTQFGVMDLT